MKKIVFVHLLNDFSGSPKVLSQVIDVADRPGVEAHLYTCGGGKGFLDNVNVRKYYFPYRRFKNKFFTLLSFFSSQIILFFKLLKYRKDPDVIFYINTMLPFGAALAGRFIGKRVVCHVHETSVTPVIFKNFLRSVINITATRIIFVSEYLCLAEAFKGIQSTVIYNGVKTQASLIHSKKDDDFFSVLMVCSLKAYKGVYEFVRLTKEFEKNQADVRFTLILNASKSEVDLFFQQERLPRNLTILTKLTDVVPYYLDSDLLLNLSRPNEWVETFGLTILEAMSHGVPVIVPPVGGPAEIVQHGQQGYLIDSANIEGLTERINYLIEHPGEYELLSNNAFERAKDFSLEVFNREIERELF